MKPAIVRFDNNLTSYIQGIPHINGFMNAVTLLGDPFLIVLIGLGGMAYAGLNQVPRLGVAFGSALFVYALGGLLKEFIHRTRPDTVYVTAMKFKSYSFPSAHALGSLLVFGMLAYLARQHLPAPWDMVVPVMLGVLIFLIGVSRVYLGAHYPTDVLGGWILGGLALFLIIKYVFR